MLYIKLLLCTAYWHTQQMHVDTHTQCDKTNLN